jgi:hypothetical protein
VYTSDGRLGRLGNSEDAERTSDRSDVAFDMGNLDWVLSSFKASRDSELDWERG